MKHAHLGLCKARSGVSGVGEQNPQEVAPRRCWRSRVSTPRVVAERCGAARKVLLGFQLTHFSSMRIRNLLRSKLWLIA